MFSYATILFLGRHIYASYLFTFVKVFMVGYWRNFDRFYVSPAIFPIELDQLSEIKTNKNVGNLINCKNFMLVEKPKQQFIG
jgi:hypothetical protein